MHAPYRATSVGGSIFNGLTLTKYVIVMFPWSILSINPFWFFISCGPPFLPHFSLTSFNSRYPSFLPTSILHSYSRHHYRPPSFPLPLLLHYPHYQWASSAARRRDLGQPCGGCYGSSLRRSQVYCQVSRNVFLRLFFSSQITPLSCDIIVHVWLTKDIIFDQIFNIYIFFFITKGNLMREEICTLERTSLYVLHLIMKRLCMTLYDIFGETFFFPLWHVSSILISLPL